MSTTSKSKLNYLTPTFQQPPVPPTPQQPLPPTNPSNHTLKIPSKHILPPAPPSYKDHMKARELTYSESGSLILNQNNLRLLCIKEGLYQFPQLNNKLYLHFKCIQNIVGLGAYVNLKTLYLENNVIRKIQNLGCLPFLENLFLQHNMITQIQNLQANTNLLVINLSYNNIFVIEGLSCLPHLQNLTITNNYLQKFESICHLGECTSTLTSIDLSYNRIVADQRLFDIVTQVKCLYLCGNPLVREIQHYRRNVVGRLKGLLYLDQRVVVEDERVLAEMWVLEGGEGMKKAKAELDKKKMEKKNEEKKQLMKDINVHRSKKILIFRKSITELQAEISKLREYQSDPDNSNMQYYYESQIGEKEQKIRELEDFIQDITCRIEGRERKVKPKVQEGDQKEESSKMVRLSVEDCAQIIEKVEQSQCPQLEQVNSAKNIEKCEAGVEQQAGVQSCSDIINQSFEAKTQISTSTKPLQDLKTSQKAKTSNLDQLD